MVTATTSLTEVFRTAWTDMPSVGGGQGGVDSDGGDVRVVVDGEGLWWLGKLYNI